MSNLNPYKVVAGNSAGIKVTATPQIASAYSNLQRLAKQGNHWARICVENINSLSSGHFKNNVFVQSDGLGKFPEFSMILPGLIIQLRKRSNSDYVIFNIGMDSNYQSLQKTFKKPGLFKVKKIEGKLAATFMPDGNILADKNRVVTISDQHESPEKAAINSQSAASNSPMAAHASRGGFDMHFTPGTFNIGGLKRLDQARNADTCPELRESALILAKTMQDARKTEGVNWISQGGGSGVLTQAMRILKEQGADFKKAEHYVFFSDLTTNLVKAESLARDIGMKFERQTKSINYFRVPPKITQLKNKLSIIQEIFDITHIFHGQTRFLMQKM